LNKFDLFFRQRLDGYDRIKSEATGAGTPIKWVAGVLGAIGLSALGTWLEAVFNHGK
jgi:hypothetical protein